MSTEDTVNEYMRNVGELAGVRHRAEKAEARIAELERERDDLRAALYKLVQVASARDDWKQSTWKFIEECNALATKGGVPQI